MKKKLFFVTVMIMMIILFSSFIVTKSNKEKTAIAAAMVELSFEDGTTAMGIPITHYFDAKGRICAKVNATGKDYNFRQYGKQDLAWSCHCNNCSCSFSTREPIAFGCCINCACCGWAIDKGWCMPYACQTCCCLAFFIE